MQAILGLREDCDFPRWMGYGMLFYMISMLVLFGNFYYKTYTRKASNHEEKQAYQKNVVANSATQKETRKKSD